MDDDDAFGLTVGNGAILEQGAIVVDVAVIRTMRIDARQHLHQGAFPSPVFPQQAQNHPAFHGQRNIVVGLHQPKSFVNVLQLNLDEGLQMFEDQSFDVVLQLDTLQHLRNAEVMLRETARVGRIGIVSFPNFAHWPNRLQVLLGRMPVTKRLPYQWYNTPNIRVGTFADFEVLAQANNLRIAEGFGLHGGTPRRWRPNLTASTAVFKFHT